MATSDPLRHWSALGTTDPAHTKPFQRAGGFRGTAIRPIESVRRMTERFGPCGVGWGMYRPEFQLVPIEGNGELMVFCTVGLWYVEDGKDYSPTELPCVYGVGGDKVVTRGRDGLRTSDEAFKSAYTDALGNAMKHIGVAADIHMGRFDDSKYVREAAETFQATPARKIAAKGSTEPDGAQLAEAIYEAARGGTYALRAFWSDLTATSKRNVCLALGASLKDGCPAELKAVATRADEAAQMLTSENISGERNVETAT